MHLAQSLFRTLTSIAAASALTLALSAAAHADRLPLVGPGTSEPYRGAHSATPLGGLITSIDPSSVACEHMVTFEDVSGGENPGTNYDGLLWSGGLQFAERFLGQEVGSSGDFDVVSGTPVNPLTPQVGDPGQNLDVFTYTSNVLAGLGHIGFPDLDAIGEGAIAIDFPTPQSRVSLKLVGGNGGSATLGFYRADGSFIDNVVVTGLADLAYGFATTDESQSISGILIQTTDPSGIGVDDICYAGGIVGSRPLSWGRIKSLYR